MELDVCTDPLGTLWAILFANPFDPLQNVRFFLDPLGTLLVAILTVIDQFARNCLGL